MYPTFNSISVEEVIARAKMSLRLGNTTEYDDYLDVLVNEALNSLGALSRLAKKTCCLSFNEQTAKLPDDFVRYLALKLDIEDTTTNDPIQNELLSGCQMYLYADTNFMKQCGCDPNGWSEGGFQISNGYIHLNGNETVLEATLAYLGLHVDEKGKPVIFEKWERAISAYLCWKYSMTYFETFNQYIIDGYRQEWVAQRAKIIGVDAAQSWQNDKREIQSIIGSLIVTPLVNYNIGT